MTCSSQDHRSYAEPTCATGAYAYEVKMRYTVI